MIIKIEVEHAIKTGKETEVLAIIKELNRRGLDRPADMLWRGLLLKSSSGDSCPGKLESNATILPFLSNSPKVSLHLSS